MKLFITSILFCYLILSCSKSPAVNNSVNRSESILIAEAASKVSPELKAVFDSLFDEWHTAYKINPEVRLSSRYVYPNQLPQYDQLVTMGESILPLVVEKMAGNDYYLSRLVYEGICPAEKVHNTNILGRERANYYIRLWTENHIHD